MRFCQITTFYPPYHYGGDAIIVQALSEHLAVLGHEVDVIYCRDSFEFDGFDPVEKRREVPGLRIHELRHRMAGLSPILTHQTGHPVLKHRAIREILDRDFDVVHFHNISLVGGPGILKMSKAPVTLYTTHEHWLVCPTHVLWKFGREPCEMRSCLRCTLLAGKPPQLWRYGGLINDALRTVDRLLAPSRFTADAHREAGITTPMEVFPFFSPIQPPARQVAAPPSRPEFIYTGRLERSKGIEQLLQAIAERPGYQLKVVGGGNLEKALKQRFGRFENIHFLGLIPHERVVELLRQVTAAIVPSWGPEVSPLTVLEALSSGVPVVVRRSGGSAEVVEAAGGGWIYDQPEELLPLLDRIADDPDQVRKAGRMALENAENNLRIEHWMDRYLGLVESIRAEKSGLAC